MTTSTIQVRVDNEMKEQAEKVFDAMGLKTSEAVRIFLQQAINDQAFPFCPHVKKQHIEEVQSCSKAGQEGKEKDKDFLFGDLKNIFK